MKRQQYRGGYQIAGLVTLARELPKQQTSAEDLLWHLLRDRQLLGFKFRRQHQLGDYVTDFFCREPGLIIECDGEIHDRNEAWHHDQNRDAYMINLGLRMFRISNERILNDTQNVRLELQQHLPSHSGIGVRIEGLTMLTKPSPRPSSRRRGRKA
ncbi:MAG TPA: endonuclease domain-containing protein [Pyrinomonadaceae bacterium]|jgi:type I restriction enzyme R subunit